MAAVGVAVFHIVGDRYRRGRQLWRLIGLVAAVTGALLYAQVVATGNLLVDVVEHVHFVEYGAIALLLYRAWRPLDNGATILWPLLAAILVGIADETVQWFVPGRVGEAHDVFLNVAAAACGLCFAASADPPTSFEVPLNRQTIRPIGYGVSAVLLSFAAFAQAVHLGHSVYDPEIGIFWSHYDAAALESMSADRARRWRAQPPTRMRRLSREDAYLSEGLWHIQERNRAWGAGDPFRAWRENLILERFFAPVLDTENFVSHARSRWPAAQRDETAARVGGDPGIYVSRAAPYPIYTWSPYVFWSAVALVVAAVMTAC